MGETFPRKVTVIHPTAPICRHPCWQTSRDQEAKPARMPPHVRKRPGGTTASVSLLSLARALETSLALGTAFALESGGVEESPMNLIDEADRVAGCAKVLYHEENFMHSLEVEMDRR